VPATLAAVAVLAACQDSAQRPDPLGPLASVESDIVATQVVTGVIGPGAIYSLHRPANWNGKLVLFAHGAVPPTVPLRLPPVPIRDSLLARGYAFAYSSRSETGLALKDGVQRTRQLRGLFVDAFGVPTHTYMVGASLGGEIALMLAEENPELLDGAVLLSAPVGGSQMALDRIYSIRVLYDYFFPGVIPGDALHAPAGLEFDPDLASAVAASLQADPARATELAGIPQAEIQYASFTELVNTVVGVLRFQIGFANDALDRTHGHSFFDNTTTQYTGSHDDSALNLGVERFSATSDAENYWQHYYQPDGRLTVPLLTLHTTRDFLVPIRHEAIYADLVASQGVSDRLVQRSFDLFGHGGYGIGQQVRAFDELVQWVEADVRPVP